MQLEVARKIIEEQKFEKKYEAMINTASVITKLLEKDNITPIIVGGLSVEIYTENDYTTRDIDFVSDGRHKIEEVLFSLGFRKEGTKDFVHDEIEISVEIPDNFLAGDYEKIVKMKITDELYVYVISIEDIILDRLRAATAWKSREDSRWGFELLSRNVDDVDVEYLYDNLEAPVEKVELDLWFDTIEQNKLPS
ncbi:hypothetical protein P9248_01310 [Bacillus subtilis]|nr:hypothetical protein [Bacillus subtilis]